MNQLVSSRKMDSHTRNGEKGWGIAIFTFVSSGFLWPLLVKQLSGISAITITVHRIVWSLVSLAIVLSIKCSWREFKTLRGMDWIRAVGAGVCTGSQWIMATVAVNDNNLIELSMAYYISPIATIVVGIVVFREQMTMSLMLACSAIACGVYMFSMKLQYIPILALSLASASTLYYVLKRNSSISRITGVFIETLTLLPLSLMCMIYARNNGNENEVIDLYKIVFLIFSGIVTTVLLVLHTFLAQTVRLITLGILQYISPTLTLLLGVIAFEEQFEYAHVMTFCFIWTGILCYLIGQVIRRSRTVRDG